jgi:hypothetical protein
MTVKTVGTTSLQAAYPIKDMRDWLSDCQWNEVDADDIAEMSAERIVRAVGRHYDGGVDAFLRANVQTPAVTTTA